MGTDYAGLDEDGLARLRAANIGIVFQSFHLVPTMTALENVALPLEFLDHDDAFAAARACARRSRAVASRIAFSRPALRRRAATRGHRARARARGPSLILADEPTGNLDLATGAQVMDLLFALKERTRRHAAAHHP